MISCQQGRQRNRNKCWEFSAIDFVGLTEFRYSIHINYTHLFVICYQSTITWIFSAELGPSACLAIINVQFIKWLHKKWNKHITISLLRAKTKFCLISILTQRHDPCESKLEKKFTWTGEPRSADILHKFYKLASFSCSLITNYGLGTASAVDLEVVWTVNYSADLQVSKTPLLPIRNVLLRHSAHFQETSK